jgi:hypothetical protein
MTARSAPVSASMASRGQGVRAVVADERDPRSAAAPNPVQPLADLVNEFACVRVSLDTGGHSPRLLVEDLETGVRILISPIELASLCLATPEDRLGWLAVGAYRSDDT